VSIGAVVLALALAACAAPAPEPPAGGPGEGRGGTFTFPLRTEPSTLDFAAAADASSVLVARLLGDSLVDHDARLRVVPRLAESWEWSPDGRILTFHLRPGVRFHDGTPLTAEDVRFTFERVTDPATRALMWIEPLLPVERLETPDPLTVRVRYRHPYGPALHGWDVPILPRPLPGGGAPRAGSRDRAPVGSGPFRFGAWESGRRLVLLANTDYWGGRPPLDRLVLEIIPSQETLLQSLLAGEVDYAALTPAQWQGLGNRVSFDRRFRTLRFVPLFLYYVAWRGDGSNPWFADPRVRRALSLALDRGGYVDAVLRGQGEIAHTLFHPVAGGADPALRPLPFDPAAAGRLLDDAGWRVASPSGGRSRDGVPLRFELLVFSGSEDQVLFAQVMQEALRRIGVGVELRRLDWPTLWGRLREGRFEAALSGVVPGPDPDGIYGLLHSSQIEGGHNYAALRDPEIDRLLDAGRRTPLEAGRATIYREMDRRFRELLPYTPLFFPIQQAALSRRFLNVEPSPRGILDHYPGAARIALAPGETP
jgi:peptide/nickel transport system substrate-binding protein